MHSSTIAKPKPDGWELSGVETQNVFGSRDEKRHQLPSLWHTNPTQTQRTQKQNERSSLAGCAQFSDHHTSTLMTSKKRSTVVFNTSTVLRYIACFFLAVLLVPPPPSHKAVLRSQGIGHFPPTSCLATYCGANYHNRAKLSYEPKPCFLISQPA